MLKINTWEQLNGERIDGCYVADNGNLVFYVDRIPATLEVEALDLNLNVGIQSNAPISGDPTWLAESTLVGRTVQCVVVPFTSIMGKYDCRILLKLDEGPDIYVAAELEHTPLRIT